MIQPKTPKKGIKVTKTESTVIKPVPAKQKYTSLGGEIGRPTGPTTGRRKTTMGSAKNGKSFPDLNKDGKITKADILKGRGVIAKNGKPVKKAKSGSKIKKAQEGALTYTNPRGKQYSLPQGASGPLNITRPNGSTRTIENREKYTKKMKRVFDRNTVDGVRQGTMTDTRQKNGGVTKKAKSGASMKKCKYGCN